MQKNTRNYNALEVMIIKKSKRRCHTMLVNFSETALHSKIYKAESFQEVSMTWGLTEKLYSFFWKQARIRVLLFQECAFRCCLISNERAVIERTQQICL